MSKYDFKKVLREVQLIIGRYSPEILTGIGISGMFAAGILAVKATPKALRNIDDKRMKKADEDEKFIYGDRENSKLTKKEIITVTWKCYVPAALTSAMSTACLLGANSINTKRNAALATAYKLSETALTEYRQKVVETVGEKKEQAVRDSIAKDKVDKQQPTNESIIITGKGDILCLDSISGQYFKGDIDKMQRSVNNLNRKMLDEMYISLNDFYYEIGMRNTKLGDELGWNINNGFIELDLSSQLTEDRTPCLVIDYKLTPKYDYSNLH